MSDEENKTQDTPEPVEVPTEEQEKRPDSNFTESKPVFLSETHEKLIQDSLLLPALNESDFKDVSDMLPRLDLATQNPDIADWVNTFIYGRNSMFLDKTFDILDGYVPFDKIADKEADYRQHVDTGEGRLSARRPKIAKSGGNGALLSGQSAMLKMNALMGMGAIIQVPLWHSGFWVSIKAPSEAALLELDSRIAREKAIVGRKTNGTVYSNSSVYMKKHIFNMIMAHVYDCNLKDWTPALIAEKLSITDLPLLTWGMLCTIYTNGYPYSRSCINGRGDCNHIVKETIDLTKILWTDNRRFSEYQLKQMQKGNVKITPEEVDKYKAEFNVPTNVVPVHDNVTLELRIPSAADYFDIGQRYVEDLEQMADKSFEQPLRGKERADYIRAQSGIIMLRRHSHWVKRVLLGPDGEEGIITEHDRETIDAALSNFSKDKKTIKTILQHIAEYMEDSVVSLTAIPSFKCPACGGYQKDTSKRFPYLIPLEVDMIFFTLTNRRLKETLYMPGTDELSSRDSV